MVEIAISILWWLVGVVILCVVVYVALWVINTFAGPLPPRVEQAVWLIVAILALIGLLTMLTGGAPWGFRHASAISSCPAAALSCRAA